MCCKFTQTGKIMCPKGSFEAGKFTVGPKAKRAGSEFEGSPKVNKSSFVEIADMF